MLGWMFDCLEKMVVDQYGWAAWHTIKSNAHVDVPDHGYMKLEHYPDESLVAMAEAAATLTKRTVECIYEDFGRFFVPYICNQGHANLLWCQGSTLKDWATNINAIHSHLQTTFPNKMLMPEFWVEHDDHDNGLLLHYVSARGGFLAPVAVGIFTEVAKVEFDLDIVMQKRNAQGEQGAKATTWRVTTLNPQDMHLLTMKKGRQLEEQQQQHCHNNRVMSCPMSGMTFQLPDELLVPHRGSSSSSSTRKKGELSHRVPAISAVRGCPMHTHKSSNTTNNNNNNTTTPPQVGGKGSISKSSATTEPLDVSEGDDDDDVSVGATSHDSLNPTTTTPSVQNRQLLSSSSSLLLSSTNNSHRQDYDASVLPSLARQPLMMDDDASSLENDTAGHPTQGLSLRTTKKLFPYHATLDNTLTVIQVGDDLPRVLDQYDSDLIGRHIGEIFAMKKPVSAKWSNSWLRRLIDQSFQVQPLLGDKRQLVFKGSAVQLAKEDSGVWMLIFCPDANNLKDLREMELTMSDLPVHGSHRDAVFLREHLSSQMNNALAMEKLSHTLQREKTLLESLLPQHAAEGLRKGRNVEPRLHNHATLFFSDIVGFTGICNSIYPWEVVNMLNKLFCIMDCLAIHFHLFKIETIGDAYVCCSGVPESDPDHATNVANFAIAVQHCVRHVLSPIDQRPIQLRIGLHSGPCASGIVGVTNPRYCVFGDTMNTTARHETTGVAGRIHCSSETVTELQKSSPDLFQAVRRGQIEMKGKGKLTTYWLKATAENEAVNFKGLQRLDQLVLMELEKMNEFEASDTIREDSLPKLEPACQAALKSSRRKSHYFI